MSAYCGILVNTSLGNPTVSFARPLGNRRVLRLVGGGALDINCLYKRIKIQIFTPCLLPSSASHPQAPAPNLQSFPPPPTSPAMPGSGSQGKWVASSITEKDVKDLRE